MGVGDGFAGMWVGGWVRSPIASASTFRSASTTSASLAFPLDLSLSLCHSPPEITSECSVESNGMSLGAAVGRSHAVVSDVATRQAATPRPMEASESTCRSNRKGGPVEEDHDNASSEGRCQQWSRMPTLEEDEDE